MAEYYFSENGTETDKFASSLINPLSVSGVNIDQFLAGDILQPSDAVTITDQIAPTSSGVSGNPIIFNMAGVTLQPVTGNAILFAGGNYVTVNNAEGIGNGATGVFVANGTAGTDGDGFTIIFNDCRVLSNGGGANTSCDGFSLSDTAQMLINNPYVRDCFRTNTPTVGSDQAFTTHLDSKMVVRNPDVANCQQWVVPVGGSSITIYGGKFTSALANTMECVEGNLTVYKSELINNLGAKHPRGSGSTTANFKMFNGSYTSTAGAETVVGQGSTLFKGVRFDVNGDSFEYNIIGVDSKFSLIGCDFGDIVMPTTGYMFRVSHGKLDILGCNINSYDSPARFAAADNNADATMTIEGNTFLGFKQPISTALIWVRGLVARGKITNNVFYSDTAFSSKMIDNDGVVTELTGNYFCNTTSALSEGVGSSITINDSNILYNSSAIGGTNEVILSDSELDALPFKSAVKTNGNKNTYSVVIS